MNDESVSMEDTTVRHMRRSMILIEVVAALALLAATTVGLLLAQSRAIGQLTSARSQAQAARLARELMTAWQLQDPDAQGEDQGVFAEDARWSWRRQAEEVLIGDLTRMKRVTLEIVHRPEGSAAQTVAAYRWLEASPP